MRTKTNSEVITVEKAHFKISNSSWKRKLKDYLYSSWKRKRTWFRVFKSSKVKPLESTEILADKGYQGIKKIHDLSFTPKKKRKKKSLTSKEKEYNRELAKQRIYVEHVIRCLKIFRILAQPYRNRRRRFGLRFNLICGLYNYELDLAIAQLAEGIAWFMQEV